MENRIFSTDSAKAIKAQEYGVINGIMYMAPHNAAGVGNLCSHASPACIAACLGMESGQAAMRKEGEDNAVTLSRKAKARRFMQSRQAYLEDVAISIAREYVKAGKAGMQFVARLNGSTDIAFEGVKVDVSTALAKKLSKIMGLSFEAGIYANMFTLFHMIQFVDYTKNPNRFIRKLPANYHLTFSRAENNERVALDLLSRGINVAVVFDKLPETWNGFTVINGDMHDLRHLDPRGAKGFVIGLLPKGRKAKKDSSGFVVRNYRDSAIQIAA